MSRTSSAFTGKPFGVARVCRIWDMARAFLAILKENLLWVRGFETVEELRQGLLAFKETYNAR